MIDKNRIKELLKEQNNTRNFSHICTKSGETIREDIIRSNILTSKEQISSLIDNTLKTIIDLRIKEEGGGDKNSIYADSTMHHLPIEFGNMDFQKISELLTAGGIEEIDSFVKNGYYVFGSDFKDEVKSFFSILLNKDNLPIAFHCSAGKDRTGMLTALFLLALDVHQDDVIRDYMETNNRIDTKKISEKITEYYQSAQGLEILFSVNLSWIEMFLQGVDENFGSVELYLKDEIGLDSGRLKEIYLIE